MRDPCRKYDQIWKNVAQRAQKIAKCDPAYGTLRIYSSEQHGEEGEVIEVFFFLRKRWTDTSNLSYACFRK